jgi:putative chitinase
MSDLSTLRTAKTQALGLCDTLDMLISLAEMEATSAPEPAVVAPEPANDPGDPAGYFDDYGRFFDFLRGNKMLGPKITTSEFEGVNTIIRACALGGYPVSFTAYALATAYLETAATMQPIKEYGGPSYFKKMYDIQGARPKKARELGNLTPGDGARYCGRGYVQLTGRRNYDKATRELAKIGFDVDLVVNPDLALRPDVAAAIMVLGMQHGWFTSHKLSDDLQSNGPSTLSQFKASRDIINGKDRDDEIAAFAFDFQTGLLDGGYSIAA